MTIRTIYLIRHGHYNTKLNGSSDQKIGSLTGKGKQQASFVADCFLHRPIKTLYSSSLPRAKETASIIAEKLHQEVHTSDLLQELIPSLPSILKSPTIALMHVSLQLSHNTIEDHQSRSYKAFETFFNPPKKDEDSYSDLIVCHGNIIRYFLCKILDINVDNWIKFDINHCGITCVTIEDNGNMKLISHNETKHLPNDLLST